MKTINFLAFPLLLITFLFSSCATNPVTGKKDFMLISKNQEKAMGQQADPEITSFFGVYDDPALQRFIRKKGREMAKVSHRSDLKYDFKIVDSPVINAFAVPGGFVYFTRGIMAHFNNEAEFAGVLGHEIGHITARHSAKQYSKAMVAELGLAAGSILSPEFARFADLARTGVGLLFLKFGRDAERQSDELGVEYSTKIGYDAEEMADFFNTLDRANPNSGEVPDFLSTHPHPQERYTTVKQLAENWQDKLDLEDPEVNRESYLKMIDGIVYGEDPKQGFVKNNVFYHPEMAFSFPVPNGWALQNTSQQVQMAPEDGAALISLSLLNAKNLNQAANLLVENYNFKVLENQRSQVNGYDALIMAVEQVYQEQAVRGLVYLFDDGKNIFNFMGVSAAETFNNYYRTFERTLSNFDQVSDPEILNIEPRRIDIVEVETPKSLKKALLDHGTSQSELQELAVLNGMELDQKLPANTLIKIIEGESWK